jgi:hypothetical protein
MPPYGDDTHSHQQCELEAVGHGRQTRRSAPELFNAAQSRGLCPGARTTFSRLFDLDDCVGGFIVLGGGINEVAEGADGPGIRGAGSGGGGMRAEGESSFDEDNADAEEIR